jgi:hypothetical protein
VSLPHAECLTIQFFFGRWLVYLPLALPKLPDQAESVHTIAVGVTYFLFLNVFLFTISRL